MAKQERPQIRKIKNLLNEKTQVSGLLSCTLCSSLLEHRVQENGQIAWVNFFSTQSLKDLAVIDICVWNELTHLIDKKFVWRAFALRGQLRIVHGKFPKCPL